jgi:hypothetical protein
MKTWVRGKFQLNATVNSLKSIPAPADLTGLSRVRLPAWREVKIPYNLGNTAQAVSGGWWPALALGANSGPPVRHLVVNQYHFVPAPTAMASPT